MKVSKEKIKQMETQKLKVEQSGPRAEVKKLKDAVKKEKDKLAVA